MDQANCRPRYDGFHRELGGTVTGPEVDVDIPEELVAAITEELQFGDRVREIVHVRQPFLDRTVRRLELDIGFQREVWLDPQHTHPPLQVGVLFENLLRADLVEPFPFRLGIGVAYEPLKWVTVAADLWRDIGQREVGFAIGGELYKMWSGEIPKSVAFRVGTGRSDATAYASVGAWCEDRHYILGIQRGARRLCLRIN